MGDATGDAERRGNALRRGLVSTTWLATPLVWLAFGAPWGWALGATAAAGIAVWRGAGSRVAALTLSGLLAWGLASVAVRTAGVEERLFYRPHERHARWNATHGHRAYEPSLDVRWEMPHGDLQPLTREAIAEPRSVRFVTDQDGFRNRTAYAGEPWLLLGDSFIAGSGNDHADLLQESLGRRGWRSHSLGFPGGVSDYADYWKAFRARNPERNPALALFVFEGNDLPERAGAAPRPVWAQRWRYWRETLVAPLREGLLARFVRSASGRLWGRGGASFGEEVVVQPLAGGPIAFYRPYLDLSRETSVATLPRFEAAFASLAPDLDLVFFVPTKYRVYQPWVASGESLPDARWRYLSERCRVGGVVCHDLTPALQARARELLLENRLVWWRDDTHWNAAGIAAAAAEVAAAFEERAIRARGARRTQG